MISSTYSMSHTHLSSIPLSQCSARSRCTSRRDDFMYWQTRKGSGSSLTERSGMHSDRSPLMMLRVSLSLVMLSYVSSEIISWYILDCLCMIDWLMFALMIDCISIFDWKESHAGICLCPFHIYQGVSGVILRHHGLSRIADYLICVILASWDQILFLGGVKWKMKWVFLTF